HGPGIRRAPWSCGARRDSGSGSRKTVARGVAERLDRPRSVDSRADSTPARRSRSRRHRRRSGLVTAQAPWPAPSEGWPESLSPKVANAIVRRRSLARTPRRATAVHALATASLHHPFGLLRADKTG